MDTSLVLAIVLSFVAVLAAALSFRSVFAGPRDAVLERVRRVTQAATRDRSAPDERLEKRKGTSRLAAVLRPVGGIASPKKTEELSRMRDKLTHAGYRGEHAIEIYYGAKIALAVLLAVLLLGVSALRTTPIWHVHYLAVVFTAVGFYSPSIWLKRKVKSRQAALGRSLPDTLDLLVTCVEAGLGLDAALARITGEVGRAAPELAGELQLTTLEIQAGVSRPDAFRRLAARTGLEELRGLSAMIIQTELFGTSIARGLRVHSATMRTRRTHRAEEQGAMVAVKMIVPLILCILPALFAVILGPAAVKIHDNLLPTMSMEK